MQGLKLKHYLPRLRDLLVMSKHTFSGSEIKIMAVQIIFKKTVK